MKLIGENVSHIKFGKGKIVEFSEQISLKVQFDNNQRIEFSYPKVFENNLVMEKASLQSAIERDIEAFNVLEAEKEAEVERQREKDKLERLLKLEKMRNKKGITKKPIVKMQREFGERKMYCVFQGDNYDFERREGVIKAPKFDKASRTPHHWERLTEVAPGDIIIHISEGYILAISTAKGKCVEGPTTEIEFTEKYGKELRKIDCDYIEIKSPINTSNYKKDIINICTAKYSPFNKNGDGNQGYLFEIDKRLAKIFINDLSKKNKKLLDIDYIRELLLEI